ncbi:hypothetical protein CRI94_11955 [Longibacter salinarum]|uniref:STAS/SEC14 domain-containing protein n=1 Tax=Longibacter salinarum TaxID=1850348 RepID=A0A2A8CVK1_9BACT|nr:hypothetical protein [Longibacter salinarum]PEN12735.1 hypothetical protein CRI94_11955 [Longibacter salinarum]
MSFSYVIDPTRSLGAAALTNRVDASAFVKAARSLYLDEDWEPGMKALWDLRFVDELVVSPADVPDMVEAVHSLRDRLGDGRAAFVAPHEPVHSISRLLLLQTHTPRRKQRVFRQLDDALEWLDVALPDDHQPQSSSH